MADELARDVTSSEVEQRAMPRVDRISDLAARLGNVGAGERLPNSIGDELLPNIPILRIPLAEDQRRRKTSRPEFSACSRPLCTIHVR